MIISTRKLLILLKIFAIIIIAWKEKIFSSLYIHQINYSRINALFVINWEAMERRKIDFNLATECYLIVVVMNGLTLEQINNRRKSPRGISTISFVYQHKGSVTKHYNNSEWKWREKKKSGKEIAIHYGFIHLNLNSKEIPKWKQWNCQCNENA